MSQLLALAAKARQLKEEGIAHADKAIAGEVLTPETRALIEELANSDGPDAEDARRELDALGSGEIAIFTTSFGRKAYLQKQVAAMATQDDIDISSVITLLFQIQSKTMPGNSGVMKPAIPILAPYTGLTEARKHHRNPISIANSSRKRKGRIERIESRGYLHLVPATSNDRETFEQMRGIIKRSAEKLIEQLDNCGKMSTRQAVWLALHFIPRSMIVTPQWRDRMFDVDGGELVQRDNRKRHLHFSLSEQEIYVAQKSPVTVRLMEQLKALSES